ncbi:hypothetical protein, partial [Brevibacillus aydinogluensis]|uniref:hypothetical protein n=1 Tax=Brevibacillus aydinogluensis TaxID=927786 RepID=UPI002892F7F6
NAGKVFLLSMACSSIGHFHISEFGTFSLPNTNASQVSILSKPAHFQAWAILLLLGEKEDYHEQSGHPHCARAVPRG